jgi:hypothetical protein
MDTEASSEGYEAVGAWNSQITSTAKLKNVWNYTSIPHMPSGLYKGFYPSNYQFRFI